MIDLRNCKKGDILICKHDAVCEYVQPLPEEDLYDHLVKYTVIDGKPLPYESFGKRCHDGYTYRYKRKDTDLDVVQVISV